MKQMKPFKDNNLFFAMGLIVAMSMLLVAFEWSSHRPAAKIFDSGISIVEELDIDLTTRTPEPPKPQIEPPHAVAPDEIVAVDEPVEHPEILSTEDTPEPPKIIASAPMPRMVEEPVETIFDFAEVSPSYAGGQAALMKFLSENMRYPQIDIETGTQGRVICTFVVEKDGSITDIKVLRGLSPSIDKEAIRVISEMPAWKPGFQNGKAVRVKFTLPIQFRLAQ